MSDVAELCVFIGTLIGAVALLLGAAFGVIYLLDRFDCSGFATATGIETRYGGFSCYAKVGDKWVPRKYVFGDAHELRVEKKP